MVGWVLADRISGLGCACGKQVLAWAAVHRSSKRTRPSQNLVCRFTVGKPNAYQGKYVPQDAILPTPNAKTPDQ